MAHENQDGQDQENDPNSEKNFYGATTCGTAGCDRLPAVWSHGMRVSYIHCAPCREAFQAGRGVQATWERAYRIYEAGGDLEGAL